MIQTKLIALVMGAALISCGGKSSKKSSADQDDQNWDEHYGDYQDYNGGDDEFGGDYGPSNPGKCGFSTDLVCGDDWFDRHPEPFRDPLNGQQGQIDNKSNSMLINHAESYLNLESYGDGQSYTNGACHVKVGVYGKRLKVQVKRNHFSVIEGWNGFRTSCHINLGVRYRPGYRFRLKGLKMNIVSDLPRNAAGQFEFQYRMHNQRYYYETNDPRVEWQNSWNSQRDHFKGCYGRECVDVSHRFNNDSLYFSQQIKGYGRTKNYRVNSRANRKLWSSCSGRESIGLSTFISAHPKYSYLGRNKYSFGNYGQDGYEYGPQAKWNSGEVYLADGTYQLSFAWDRCN